MSLLDKVKPKSSGQEELLQALKSDSYEVIGVFGPTGTGKSLLSITYGIDSVMEGKYQRFVIVKPVVDIVTGREVTTIDAGELYYDIASSYLKDILTSLIEWQVVEKVAKEGRLLFADAHYLRGRTFDKTLIFVDDAQAIMPECVVETFMRIGHKSKLVIAGDPILQSVLETSPSGVVTLREVLLGEDYAKVIDLGLKDIIRPGAKRGIKLLLEMKMRKRPLNDVEKNIIDVAKMHAPDADIVTVLDLIECKRIFDIAAEHVPDALVVVKEGYLARLIGKSGDRISKIEREVQLKLRAVELTLNFADIVRAIHPVSWIHKHITDVDFAGPNLMVKVKGEFGAFVGQRGSYIKFLNSAFNRLMGVGIVASEDEDAKERAKEKIKKRAS
ncbi:MAG: PhoH family protein [Candidatus Nezhaarchaeales archaeon]